MCQVRDQIVLAMRLVTQSLLHLALTVTHAVKGALDLQEVAVNVVPGVGVIDQAILNTSGQHTIGMLLALLVALVVQGAAAKEQHAHGKRQHKAKHVEYKAGIEQHRPFDAAECHGANRQRHGPRGTANHHAAAYDFKSIDQQKADKQHRQDSSDVIDANQQQAQQKEQHRCKRAVVDDRPHVFKESIGHLECLPIVFCHIHFPTIKGVIRLCSRRPRRF